MRIKLFIVLFLLVSAPSVSGQSAKQADDLFNAREYAAARSVYDALLRKQPTHPLYLYRAARCAQETGDYTAAEELFIKAGTKYPLRNFFLGELYFDQWRMAEALTAYEACLTTLDPSSDRWATIQQHISEAQIIARYLKHVSRIEVLGVRRLPVSELPEAYLISRESGTLRIDSLGSSFTTQRGDRRYFSVRTTEPGDSLPVERVVLVSQQRLLEQWEDPDTLRATVNSGRVNSYPYVLTDGATLYFASDREGGLGGLDIYMTRYNAALGEWLPAENIGMPYNSPADDYLYVADELNGCAYFATNRHCAGTDSVEVYQVALGDRTFLRGLPDSELVPLARLDSVIPLLTTTFDGVPANTPTLPAKPARPVATAQRSTASDANDSIYFVLNDEYVYTHLEDFHSDSARTLYRRYIRMQHTQEQAIEMLDSLRHQYYEANDATRASLKARIPILSSEIDERKRLMRNTLTQIRSLESAR